MKRILLLWLLLIASATTLFAQSKKVLDHDVYDDWRRTGDESISADGRHIVYTLESNGIANDILELKDFSGREMLQYERGSKGQFSYDGDYLIFKISPDLDSVKTMRRNKVKKEELPKDSLMVYGLTNNSTRKIPHIVSYGLPKKWSGWLAYQHEVETEDSEATEEAKKKPKKQFTIEMLDQSASFHLPEVEGYHFSEKGDKIAFVIGGKDSIYHQGVYVFDAIQQTINPIFRARGKYHSLTWSEDGSRLAFVSDLDTTKAQIRPNNLHLWITGQDSASTLIAHGSKKMGDGRLISEHFENRFSKDNSKLYFGLKPYPVLQDTSLLEEEIVNVEVWSYEDQRLFTQQEIEKEKDLKKAYMTICHLDSKRIVTIADDSVSEVSSTKDGNATKLLGINSEPYQMLRSWEGGPLNSDLFVIDGRDGSRKLIKQKVKGQAALSPAGKYIYWYDYRDSAWFTYDIGTAVIHQVTDNNTVPFYRERHDTPSLPGSYGLAGWSENDEKLLIYDRYDIWEIKPDASATPKKITPDGRSGKIVYRYVKLNEEEEFIENGQQMMLTAMDEKDKSMAIYVMQYGRKNKLTKLHSGDYPITQPLYLE